MADDRHGTDDVDDETLDAVAEALRTAETAVALTGAGVSTASGIPSFRGDDGIWERHDPADFHRRRLDADPAGFWADRLSLREAIYGDIDPEPNAAHEALAALEADGHLDAVLTQNIDGLHDAAGTDRVVELHGTHRRVVCDDCGHRRDAEVVFEQAAESSDLPPRCDCGGVYRPDVVLFGEPMPDVAMNEAQRLARDSDVFLAVGSSLSVQPASLLPKIAAEGDSTLVVVNYEETPRDASAAHVLRADVTQVLPAIVERL
ncbi:NAD-dependent protein deacylase [Haloarcula hispanica]|uniref:NAD-dependent protein deacylase n=1 Tax=Haloarcula hispanica TaxID=51589 RepID=UPI0011B59B9C|nr:NAD-dependent protein deacylase [Haloarcula hispanica]